MLQVPPGEEAVERSSHLGLLHRQPFTIESDPFRPEPGDEPEAADPFRPGAGSSRVQPWAQESEVSSHHPAGNWVERVTFHIVSKGLPCKLIGILVSPWGSHDIQCKPHDCADSCIILQVHSLFDDGWIQSLMGCKEGPCNAPALTGTNVIDFLLSIEQSTDESTDKSTGNVDGDDRNDQADEVDVPVIIPPGFHVRFTPRGDKQWIC